MAAMAAVTASAILASAGAHAQEKPLEVWQPPQQTEPDPAKRTPRMSQPVDATDAAAQSQTRPTYPQAYTSTSRTSTRYEKDRGGFFVGVQGGKGWVYEDVDQSALMVNAGYRWQAGDVTLVGIEAAGGQLDDAEHEGWYYSGLDYASLGANARFNFGRSNPVYGLIRGGYWSAHNGDVGSVEGGYFGVGLGVDFNRHFNMSLVYTNHVYFNDAYWSDGDFYYDANRAETLMLGAEARF